MTVDGSRIEVPEGSKRLLVIVALHRGRIERRCAAGALWPIGDDLRASGNLRSALWRLKAAGIDLLAADKWSLKLRDDVAVDVHLLNDWATRLIRDIPTVEDLAILPSAPDALDLLPGWYDDWVRRFDRHIAKPSSRPASDPRSSRGTALEVSAARSLPRA
ncbi:hypothetical protein [Paractinoplanes maris]|uniref:hypothetical protein n=1 Tax=Paractinoplanes maris TaxID=1734446 RepID=UPI002022690C|nr:hypothetical protein [Actinoplanes maris]